MRSKSAENAILYFEAGQEISAMAALADSGDRKKFESGDMFWSGAGGKEPVVRPDGLVTGGVVSAASSGAVDAVDIAALTCYLAGVLVSVAGSVDETIARPLADVSKVNSITVTSAGAIAVIEGTDGNDTSFSSTRGVAGGPPFIPVGSIEIAQVRVTESSSAAISSTEIFQVVGTHQERYDYPLWDEDWTNGEVEFLSALPAIHTGDEPKGVYAEYYTPLFSEVPNASDFVPPENSHSVSSEQVYGGAIGSTSVSLGQGSFTARLQNGVDDNILAAQDDTRWFKFYPDRLVISKYVACQGKLGIARTYPAGGNMQAACTISATQKAENITS